VWFQLFNKIGLAVLAPQLEDTSFAEWWIKTDKLMSTLFRKGVNSLITIGAWVIWKQRSNGEFNNVSSTIQTHLFRRKVKCGALLELRSSKRSSLLPVRTAVVVGVY
jgi:hypothetical protein